MLVLDEQGLQWDVAKGEPAWAAVQYLKKLGYTEIVLPLAILLKGHRTDDLPWPTSEQATVLDNSGKFGYTSEEGT